MARTAFGDISPRVAAYAATRLLERAIPHMVLEKFGQSRPLPSKSSDTMKFRRYEAFPYAPNELTEGVTPAARRLTKTDVTVSLKQYGDLVELTDQVQDLHEDPVMQESSEILGEQAGQMLETVRFNVLKAGTNVFFSNGSGRGDVNTAMTKGLQQRITRALKRQNATKVTQMVQSTPDFNTESLEPAYIAVTHPDVEPDIRAMTGFVSVADYGNRKPMDGEIGTVDDVRYIGSTLIEPFTGAGNTTLNGMISENGTNVDVYPILIFGANAYAIVPFKGKNAVTPSVINPGQATKDDPLGQRGYAGWKAYHAAAILNDNWLVRLELGATENP